MAKIDLTRQAKAPQQSGQFLRTTNVTSSLTNEYHWETADFNFTGSFTGSFSGSFEIDRIQGLGIVSSSTQIASFLPAGSVSSSAQIAAAVSGSLSKVHIAAKIPEIVSGAAQVKSLLPSGIRSGSDASNDIDQQTLSYNPSTYGLSITNGNSVDLSGLAGGGGGGGSGDGLAITASNEGSLLSSNIRSFNFVGPAITATSDGNAITITSTTGSRVVTSNVTASMFLLREIVGATPTAADGGIMYSGSAFYVGL